jgi:hypothetical protein
LLTYVSLKDSTSSPSPSPKDSFSRHTDSSIMLFNQSEYMNYERRSYVYHAWLYGIPCSGFSLDTNTTSWAESIGMLNFSDFNAEDDMGTRVCGGSAFSIAKSIVLDTFNGIPVLHSAVHSPISNNITSNTFVTIFSSGLIQLKNSSDFTVSVYSLTGRLVSRVSVWGKKWKARGLGRGMYLAEVYAGGRKYYGKITLSK